MPRGFSLLRWCRQNPQVLLVPKRQRFRIFRSKEDSSDSTHFFHFRSSRDPITNSGPRRERGALWLYGRLRSDVQLVAIPDKARPDSNYKGSQNFAFYTT